MSSRYSSYARDAAGHYPSLRDLADYLHKSPGSSVAGEQRRLRHLQVVDGKSTSFRDVGLHDLVESLHTFQSNASEQNVGLIIVVEDPDAHTIETIGAALNISLTFFASYASTTFEDVVLKPLPPLLTRYPSQVIKADHLDVHFQRVVGLGRGRPGTSTKMTASGNISRPVRRVQDLSGQATGLLRTCYAVHLTRLRENQWVGGAQAGFFNDSPNSHKIPGIPYSPRPESIADLTEYSIFGPDAPTRKIETNFDRICQAYEQLADGLSLGGPSVLDLGYCLLRTGLAEWRLYAQLMERFLAYYEYTIDSVSHKGDSIRNHDAEELHRWRRRSKQSLHKLRTTRTYVNYWRQGEPDHEKWKLLLEDIDFIINDIDESRQSFETLSTIAASMIQLAETRRSLIEATSVRHLTVIALIFAPLSFMSSLFSMSDPYGPGNSRFWMYWVTALPILFAVLAFWSGSARVLDNIQTSIPSAQEAPSLHLGGFMSGSLGLDLSRRARPTKGCRVLCEHRLVLSFDLVLAAEDSSDIGALKARI